MKRRRQTRAAGPKWEPRLHAPAESYALTQVEAFSRQLLANTEALMTPDEQAYFNKVFRSFGDTIAFDFLFGAIDYAKRMIDASHALLLGEPTPGIDEPAPMVDGLQAGCPEPGVCLPAVRGCVGEGPDGGPELDAGSPGLREAPPGA